MRKILISSLMLLGLMTSACTIYRPDIQQGNLLESKEIAKLKPGMTKTQVLYLMGTPLLSDPFHQDRWDYIHTLKKPKEKMTRQRITLYFENDLLARVDSSALDEQIVR